MDYIVNSIAYKIESIKGIPWFLRHLSQKLTM